MNRSHIAVIGIILLSATAMVGCDSKDEHQHLAETADQKSTKTDAPSAGNSQSQTVLNWCIVSGETLGEMGDPVHYKYKDREMTFCCKSCVREFEANPIAYLARLDSALAGQIQQPTQDQPHSH